MKIFCTAVGDYYEQTKARSCYSVFHNGQEHSMTKEEMTLWMLTMFEVSRPEELYQKFYAQMMAQNHYPNRTAQEVYNRLKNRNLIAEGHGEADIDAIENLLMKLQIKPIYLSWMDRITAFFRYLFLKRYPLQNAIRVFRKYPASSEEVEILSICNGDKKAIASVITLFGSERKNSFIISAVNLYLNKQVIFSKFCHNNV